jgi:hypothetical protein
MCLFSIIDVMEPLRVKAGSAVLLTSILPSYVALAEQKKAGEKKGSKHLNQTGWGIKEFWHGPNLNREWVRESP